MPSSAVAITRHHLQRGRCCRMIASSDQLGSLVKSLSPILLGFPVAAAVRRGAFLCAPSQASAPQGAPPHGGGSAFNGAFGGEGGFIDVGLVAEAPTDAASCGGTIPIRRLHSRFSSLSISGCVCVPLGLSSPIN